MIYLWKRNFNAVGITKEIAVKFVWVFVFFFTEPPPPHSVSMRDGFSIFVSNTAPHTNLSWTLITLLVGRLQIEREDMENSPLRAANVCMSWFAAEYEFMRTLCVMDGSNVAGVWPPIRPLRAPDDQLLNTLAMVALWTRFRRGK